MDGTNTMLRDKDIRLELIKKVSSYQDTDVLEEFSILTAPVRADLVTINGHLTGFEIKSDVDSLSRLPHQFMGYDKAFELNYLVVGEKLSEAAAQLVPSHWGIFIAQEGVGNNVILRRCKQAKINPFFEFDSFLFAMPLPEIRKKVLPLLSKRENVIAKEMIKQDLIRYIDQKTSNRTKNYIKKMVREKLREKSQITIN
ncbi:hypothetical protein LCIT_03280 [Leuconostoc citreum]|uniref:Sce7726 family protein n=1 Tax=Leuconostoc citreum TaxID=33964 RepID=A0A5A5TZ64_LEUCI|nr:sce7726 family protein [Leuconostoc citreum]GDZ83086.1 hypothetical protein LCIT_03280 [Leuconostoc citreum]